MGTTRAINVLIVHGVGWGGKHGKQYAQRLQANIGAAFRREVRRLRLRDVSARDTDPDRALRFAPVYWAPVTQQPQDALLSLMGFGGWWPLRKFNLAYIARRQMIGLLGDVITYEGGPHNSIYKAIHTLIEEGAGQLCAGCTAESGDAPGSLSIVGHSLGSVVASDFVWDHTRGASPEHVMSAYGLALTNMFTMGSPLAIYALRGKTEADKQDLANSLPSPIQVDPHGGVWINLYDTNDPIAFPLQPIRSYRAAGVIDSQVRAGNWLTSWNPASHMGYWQSAPVANVIGRKLALDWAAVNSPRFAEQRYLKMVEQYRRAVLRA